MSSDLLETDTPTDALADDVRSLIMETPEALLDDPDLMRALVTANERSKGNGPGDKIVDLRGIAMDRLSARLDRLEDTHRNVIAAAYENLAGTNQIHRAILRMMDGDKFESFLRDMHGGVADILRVDAVHLVLETASTDDDPAVARLGDVLCVVEPGFIDSYITEGRSTAPRQVTLRPVKTENTAIFGAQTADIRSEACLLLDLGEGRLPGMLVFGAQDVNQFTPQQGTDLLTFFGNVFERVMQRWLN